MPDMTVEIYPMCMQLEPYRHAWNVGGYIQSINRFNELVCTCKGYHYRKSCKHIKEVDEIRCVWHGMFDEPMEKDDTCPRCGGPITYVKALV